MHVCAYRVQSPIDGLSLEDVESVRVRGATDYSSERHIVRWTELFIVRNDLGERSHAEPADLSRVADSLAQACCLALSPNLDKLALEELTKIGLRVTIDSEQVCFFLF